MTEQEAIKVFDGLRKAYQALKPGEDLRALHALLTAHVVSSSLSQSCSSALGTLRTVFDEIDKWEGQHQN